MKTKIFTALMFFFLFTNGLFAQSRCEKGTWVVGVSPGNFSFFDNSKWAIYYADTIRQKISKNSNGFSLGYNFSAGYFVKNNFCIGGGLYGTYGNMLTALFARYYLLRKEHCFSFTRQDKSNRSAFFVQGLINWGYSSENFEQTNVWDNVPAISKEKNTGYTYGGQAAIGYTYIVTRNVALELLTFYSNYNHVGKFNGSVNGAPLPITKNIYNNNTLSLSLGIQTYF